MAIEPARINVLLIEDNPGDARLIIEYLSPVDDQKFNVAVAERLGAGLKMLEKLSFDVVLLDLTLPDSDGLGTVEKFHDRMPLIPVIVLTGLDDEAAGVAAGASIGARRWRAGREPRPATRSSPRSSTPSVVAPIVPLGCCLQARVPSPVTAAIIHTSDAVMDPLYRRPRALRHPLTCWDSWARRRPRAPPNRCSESGP